MKPFPTSAACCFGILFISVSLITTGSSEVQVVGLADPVVTLAGDDVILPCFLKPNVSAEDMLVEWTRLFPKAEIVHLYRDGRDSNDDQHPSYKGRTSMFHEELKNGNVSLKLTRVTLSDAGSYRCFIPTLTSQVKETTVQLFVGAVSLPVVSIDGTKGLGVVLKCESGGWYPEPEMVWLDSSGSILPADGPPEKHWDSEGLCTVIRHVTVNQTDTNRFTCRVNQTEINHKKETEIYVPDDLFPKGVPKSHVGLIVGLLIAAAVVLLAASAVGVYIWRKHKDEVFPKSRMWWIVGLLITAAVVLAAFAGVYGQRELEDDLFPKGVPESHVGLIVGLSITAAVVVLAASAVGVYMWRKHKDEVFPKSRMWWIVGLLITAAVVLAAFAVVYLQRELEDELRMQTGQLEEVRWENDRTSLLNDRTSLLNDAVTRERDELKEQLRKAEVTIKTLSTSPGGQQKTQTPSQNELRMQTGQLDQAIREREGMEMKPLLDGSWTTEG